MSATHADPIQGEVWRINVDSTIGREQANDEGSDKRLCLVVSDQVLLAWTEIAIVVPLTGHELRNANCHEAPDGKKDKIDTGLLRGSILCEQVRAISTLRHKPPDQIGRFCGVRAGEVSKATLRKVLDRLNVLLS